MAEVRLDQINKTYHGRRHEVQAVRDLDLAVENGEFVSILGPSGCGKSTTLRMIVGLEEPTSGDILFDGVAVTQLDPQERNVAMAFESYALYPNFSAEENIGFPLEARRIPLAERQRRVRELAELLQIEHILHQKPHTLSGGQKQRVSLARALIREPAAFILDEVLGHVDGHLRFQMLFDLKRLHQSLASTMIFVTHDQIEALALSDRIAILDQGRLMQCGTRDELYRAPVSRFVADFIGEPPTNFFDARVVEDAGDFTLRADGIAFRVTQETERRLRGRAQAQIIVGLRPQNLSHQPKPGSHALETEVRIYEYLGERSIVTVRHGATLFQALAPADEVFAPGDRLTLYYKPDDVMVFDAETEGLIA